MIISIQEIQAFLSPNAMCILQKPMLCKVIVIMHTVLQPEMSEAFIHSTHCCIVFIDFGVDYYRMINQAICCQWFNHYNGDTASMFKLQLVKYCQLKTQYNHGWKSVCIHVQHVHTHAHMDAHMHE